MAEVEIAYKGSLIASLDASGSKTLLTEGKYCEDDIAVYYARPSGGSNTPVAEATITSVTESGNNRSFDIMLSRPITKGVLQFVADATTQASIYADTSTVYYLVSLFILYPVEFLDTGTTSTLKCGNLTAYRGSTGNFAIRTISATSVFNITVNGTTMTVQWLAGIANFFPSGTYKVTVWEIADS